MIRISLFLAAFLLVGPVYGQAKVEIPIEKDITFGKVGDVELKLDIARPAMGKGPFPVVVCIHGGAWQVGHRGMMHNTIRTLAQNGYVAATISYRLAPKFKFPSQVEDCKCAIRFLRSKVKDWNLDSERFVVLGESAGAHLALLVGLMPREVNLEGDGGCAECSSKVQAIVNYFGPTDFPSFIIPTAGEAFFQAVARKTSSDILKDFVGSSDRDAPIMKTVSPVTYIHKGDPPVLTFHGTYDILVPVQQARVLHEALNKAEVPNRLELLEGAGHGWGGVLRDRTNGVALEFLRQRLK